MLQVGDEEKEVVRGARMRDMLTRQEWDVKAKVVVNATGGEWGEAEREGEGGGRGEGERGKRGRERWRERGREEEREVEMDGKKLCKLEGGGRKRRGCC